MATLAEETASGLGQRIQPTFGYYRQPDGWITISPITQFERVKYAEQGWTHLEHYGAFDMMAYTANHPFEGLFMMGGAKEMSAEQVLQTGLYIDPPLVPRCRQHLTQYHRAHTRECWRGAQRVEFPQMSELPKERIGPFVCDFCKRKMATVEARTQHQSVAHSKPLGNIQLGQTMGDTLAGALARAAAPSAAPDREASLLARIAELEAKSAPARETCGCGATYKAGGTTFHQRSNKHKEWAKKQGVSSAA